MMHVAVVGMGALGRVYGVRLANRAHVKVTFVVRRARDAAPIRLTRIDGDGASDVLEAPKLETHIPQDADVALVCVRAEQLDASLDALLKPERPMPVVMLTPLLPNDLARLASTYGPRLVPAMAGVVSYLTDDQTCRYWLPRVAPTLLDKGAETSGPVHEATEAFVKALHASGLPARMEAGVKETNPATTVSFIPLMMGIDAAGGVEALLADRELLRLSLDALGEGMKLASKIGKAPAWVDALARFTGPMTLKIGVGLARRGAPEALRYVDDHFGRKLHAQNVAMARAIVELAADKKTPGDALARLRARLEAVT
jgi:hypothetical protein